MLLLQKHLLISMVKQSIPFLKFPVTNSHKDLSGKSLVQLQEKVLNVDYIMIDDYSMPGQSMFRWIDRCCKKATGLKQQFFGHQIWPTRTVVNETMPQNFKDFYLFTEMPSSLRSQSKTYSYYQHHNTAKGLVGIAPSGMITFVSDLYSGRKSDKEATKDCGILFLLEEGGSIMVDKGFDIEDVLPKKVSLNIPPFLRENDHLSLEEETETRRIAALCIHVERAIHRIKCFQILKIKFPSSMAADQNKMWVICAYLCNFLPPIIAESE